MSKDFHSIAKEIAALVAERQKTYGDSFSKSGDVLRVLYPDGIKPEQYVDALGVLRVVDKLFRVANGQMEDSWRDIAGYGLLGEARQESANWAECDLHCVDCRRSCLPKGCTCAACGEARK
jgi:hypothetical protein